MRKTVTVVFADVTGSTGLGERLDPESVRRIMIRYFDEMRAGRRAARRAPSRSSSATRSWPSSAYRASHEDDALRGVRAAAEMRDRLAALNEDFEREWGVQLEMRIGVNTGEVVAGDATSGQSLAVGDAVNVAARLEQAAEPGEILVGRATYRLVRDAVEFDDPEELQLRGEPAVSAARRLRALRPAERAGDVG